MERDSLPWRGRACHGEGEPAMERDSLPWRGRTCHGKGEPAMERESLPWRGRACHGKGEPAMERESLPWRGRACHGEGGPAIESTAKRKLHRRCPFFTFQENVKYQNMECEDHVQIKQSSLNSNGTTSIRHHCTRTM